MFDQSAFSSRTPVRWRKHVRCSLFAMTLSAQAFAATLYVDPVIGSDALNDCLTETSPCETIAVAVSNANDGDEIVLLTPGPYYEHDIVVFSALTLTGMPGTSIDAGGLGRHFLMATDGEVKLSDMQLINGDADTENGGAIDVIDGSLELVRVDVLDCAAERGGAVSCEDDCSGLMLKQSDFTDNSATYGGAVSTIADTTVHKSNFLSNRSTALAGAIYNDGLMHEDPRLVIYDSQFSENESGSGGALYSSYGDLSVYRSSFYANMALMAAGALSLSGTDNVLKIVNTTFAENSAPYTGAITTGSGTTARLFNVTFNDNSSTMNMQDFFMGGEAEVHNSIITHQTLGGGFFIPMCAAATGVVMTGENNLMDKFCETPTSATFFGGTLSVGSFGALDIHGASTLSYKLLAGSNAIDTGASSCPGADGNPLVQDQRRRARPAGAACDVGAFERQ